MQWKVNFYLTESNYILGIPSFTFTLMGSRESVALNAANMNRTYKCYNYEVLPLPDFTF